MNAIGLVIGMVAIMFGSQFITLPLARELARRQGGDIDRLYIPVDVGVMGTIGFVLGWLTHGPIIGISLSPRGWPGMIAMIAASFLASRLG